MRAVTTRVFPGLADDRMALKLHGKQNCLTRKNFLAQALTIGLIAGDAHAAINEVADRLAKRVQTLRLPAFANQSDATWAFKTRFFALIEVRSARLGGPAE